MRKHKKATKIIRSHHGRVIMAVVAMVGVAIVGIVLTFGSHAATGGGAVEAEATVTTPAIIIAETAASGGKAVQFGAGTPDNMTPVPVTGGVSFSNYGGKCDGISDDTAALNNAIANLSAKGGGVLNLPAGTCKVTGAILLSGSGVTVNGASQSTTTMNEVGSPPAVVTVSGTNLRIQNIKLVQSGQPGYWMFNLSGSVNGFTAQQVTVDGRYNGSGNGIHGFHFNNDTGNYRNINILQSTFQNTFFGLLTDNPFPGTVDNFTVDGSTFHDQWGDDLEFNAPDGHMSNVTVKNSNFYNNHYRDPSLGAGIGIGLANVQTASLLNNKLDGYFLDPIHVEDRSSNITVSGNVMTHSFATADVGGWQSHIFIVNGVHDMKITGNTCDTSGNVIAMNCVYMSSGGGISGPPYNIQITGNTFKLRPNAGPIANYGTNVTISSNVIIPVP